MNGEASPASGAREPSGRPDRVVGFRRPEVEAGAGRFEVIALDGIPEVRAGDDLASMIVAAYTALGAVDGDILVVTSKVVSKAEGRTLPGDDREAAIDQETVREVARIDWNGGSTRIVENRQGLVLAAAGVDASNVDEGVVLLLPEDPDASARAIAEAVRAATGQAVGVIVSDTLGRAWRIGQTDHAIGAAGVVVADDLRGTTDSRGRILEATIPAVGDELAAAADLAKGKASGRPVAVIRGLGHLVSGLDAPGARSLQRPIEQDSFREGANEAWRRGYEAALEGLGYAATGTGANRRPAVAAGGSLGEWTLILPVKPGPTAKSRLEVPGVDRTALAQAIALDTLEQVMASHRVARVLLVGGFPALAETWPAAPIEVVADPGAGLAAAIDAGLSVAGEGVPRAVLLGDLPGLQPHELDATLRLADSAARAFVPDAEGTGTVIATVRAGMPFEPRFGEGSAARHRAAGFIELHLPERLGLRQDVDTVEQLRRLALTDRLGPRTSALLRDWIAGLR